MEVVINLLRKRIKHQQVFSEKDILRIYTLLIKFFQVTAINKIYFVRPNIEKYFMGYHVDNYNVHIDYQQINKNRDVRLVNYEILFAILHEIRHAKQMECAYSNISLIGDVYRVCFDYIKNFNSIISIYYYLYHDIFPIEFNANISAYHTMIYICRTLGDNNYKEYYEKLLMDSWKTLDKKNQESLLDFLFAEDFLLETRNKLSAYDLVINGLEIDENINQRELKILV